REEVLDHVALGPAAVGEHDPVRAGDADPLSACIHFDELGHVSRIVPSGAAHLKAGSIGGAMTDANETVDLEAIHRAAAPHAFNETWQYLDRDHLTPAEEEAMLSAAFAQRYHWYAVGDPRNRAIADWQVSRATVVAGYAELADRFARRSLETCL